jgi:uncharacterized protein (DUF1015 family)
LFLSCHFDFLPLTFNFLKSMEVSPFRGIRYNQRIVGDLAQIICPPYDIITPEQQKLYYKKSDYNTIRLEFPEPTGDRYQRAAITFQQWLKHGILQLDSVSSFYLHDHHFEYSGEMKVRRGLIARVKLEPWGSGIYPHEETSPKAKSDRLQLMRACRANFSPLFSLYHDSERKVTPILSHVAQKKPLMSLRVPILSGRSNLPGSNEVHILWVITEPETKRELSQFLSSQPLYIADGHHRYETALTYQQERTKEQSDSFDSSVIATLNGVKRKQSLTGKGAFNYVMIELVDFSDPGLLVLPLHRLVRGIAPSALAELEKQLENFFTLEFVSLSEDSLAPCHCERSALFVIASEAKQSHRSQGIVLGVLGLHAGALVLLRRRQDISLEAMMPGNRSQAYREFGVSILNHIILDAVLSGAKDLDVAYTVDLKEAYQQIKEGKYQLAFLLNPPQLKMVKAVADAQDRMPSKSTYFYPKLPAGLIINPLD